MSNNNKNVGNVKKNKATSRRYNACGEIEYNARTYIIKIKWYSKFKYN